MLLSCQVYPRVKVSFGGNDAFREPMEIDAEQFIAVKGFKAKGKRITTWQIESIEELEPTSWPESLSEDEGDSDNSEEAVNLDPDAGKTETK